LPIVVLTARSQESDTIEALNAGANDYVTKPFTIRELLVRVRTALRLADRNDGAMPTVFAVRDLRVDV
jgi:two-component system, OmpR family, KDP operon response regulator KdpE